MVGRGETGNESAPLGLHSAAQGHVGCRPHPSRRCRARRGPKATRTRDCRSLWAASQDVAAKPERPSRRAGSFGKDRNRIATTRSEEHTSELQSLMRNSYAVFCLKKKKKTHTITY